MVVHHDELRGLPVHGVRPAVDAGDAGHDPTAHSVELGVKFRADANGYITGVRFYKGATNTGVHTGTLWSSTGTQLATATFSGESATGWQQVNFSSRVAVTANTTYVVSYHTPTSALRADSNAFTARRRQPARARARERCRRPATASSPTHRDGFPATSGNNVNYWVDAVYTLVRTRRPTVTTSHARGRRDRRGRPSTR